MSFHARAVAMPHSGRHTERLPPVLALPLIAGLSVAGWWLLWQAGWAVARALF
jgi:hypothetical protein